MASRAEKASAFVISYNRAAHIGTCVRALGFVDEVILIDKSSTDGTPDIARPYVDRVITIPWSPTADGDRAFAVEQCSHDWIIWLDDDELLSPGAIRFISKELEAPRFDVYGLLQLDHWLGVHDKLAGYWPDCKPKLFRRSFIQFTSGAHACVHMRDGARLWMPELDSDIAFYNLSHASVADWISKTNRYTSQPDRRIAATSETSLVRFAHDAIAHWARDAPAGSYAEACNILRAVYDIIDRLKVWEQQRGIDGEAALARVCAELDQQYRDMGIVWTRLPT